MATMNDVGVGLASASGSGMFVGNTSPTLTSPVLTTPVLGTPVSGNMINCSGVYWGAQVGTNIPLQFVSGTLSAAQILALNGTPIAVIGAQGANTLILVYNYAAYYDYNSTPYTAGASQTIRLVYGTGTTPNLVTTVFTNGVLTGTADAFSCGPMTQQGAMTVAQSLNVGVYFKNPVGTEVTAGDSIIRYYLWYTVINVTAV